MKNFCVILLALAVFCTLNGQARLNSGQTQGLSLRMLEKYATKSGHIPLVLKEQGFFAHVDFANHQDQASDEDVDNDDYGNMMLALYTDKTFFGKKCQGFSDYCEKYKFRCELPKDKHHLVFPYFETDSQTIISEVFLDYSHWSLKSMAHMSTQCSGFYSGGYGLLGVGVDDDSLINFLNLAPTFAIEISKDLLNGTFAFDKNLQKAQSSTPLAKLNSSGIWHVSDCHTISIQKTTIFANASLIFDLGSDSLGFPVTIYREILAALQNYPSIGQCQTNDDFRPTCQFSGDIRELPKIIVNIGDQELAIPPEIYVIQTQSSFYYYESISLKIKALSTNTAEGFYVTPDHSNYIILGYPIMSYYYMVFDGGHKSIDPKRQVAPSISLYPSKNYNSSVYMWIIALAGLLVMVSVGLIYYQCQKHKKARKEKAKARETSPLLEADHHAHPIARRPLH